MKNVLVAISGDSNAARELLIGLFEYANTRRDWSVRLLGRANDLTPARVDAAVAEIARSVGFFTASRFSHYFKKCRGVSPENWRRQRKKGQNR